MHMGKLPQMTDTRLRELAAEWKRLDDEMAKARTIEDRNYFEDKKAAVETQMGDADPRDWIV